MWEKNTQLQADGENFLMSSVTQRNERKEEWSKCDEWSIKGLAVGCFFFLFSAQTEEVQHFFFTNTNTFSEVYLRRHFELIEEGKQSNKQHKCRDREGVRCKSEKRMKRVTIRYSFWVLTPRLSPNQRFGASADSFPLAGCCRWWCVTMTSLVRLQVYLLRKAQSQKKKLSNKYFQT